jgi:tetratricopeptide (TPR) repeat protein
MKFNIILSVILLTLLGISSDCLAQNTTRETNESEKDAIVVEGALEKGTIFVGTKDQIEGTKRSMKELMDPADDYAIRARDYYDRGDYDKAEQECLQALQLAKQGYVKTSAHRTLSYIYEKTKRYDLSIKEIDWLLQNVNEYAKPDLLKKKVELEKILHK